ncbi:MAG TPA: HDOD domain-containing protein [Terriglobales bacterium]|nr:HDOD domain-containing protein [Terriglobales bacterium]
MPALKFPPRWTEKGNVDSTAQDPAGQGKGGAGGSQRFVARQPILDRSQKVLGYELLFRNGFEEYFRGETENAARSTLDTSLVIGLDTLCDGRRAFVNCTSAVLLKDLVTLLPPNQTVVEVLETVEPDERIIAAIRRLKENGYAIALDDFGVDDPRAQLAELADVIKVDIRATTAADRSALMSRYRGACEMLAEKVESQEEFRECFDLGFSQFQGFFFRRPEIVAVKQIPANRVTFLRLLEMVSRPTLDLDDLEKVFKHDATICYRLLRHLNSPAFGFRNEIRSVRHALAILGERELRRWVRLLVTLTASSEKSPELVISALIRARFCELMSQRLQRKGDLFLLGLLSLMDAILEVSMATILEQVPVDHETKAVLSSQPSSLRPLYQLLLAQESGEWDECSALARQLGLPEEQASATWWQAVEWAQQITHGVAEEPATGAQSAGA